MTNAYIAAVAALAALNAADLATTLVSLRRGAREANFIVVWIGKLTGLEAAVVIAKLIGFALCVNLLIVPISLWVVLLIDAIYAAAVVHNYRVYKALAPSA